MSSNTCPGCLSPFARGRKLRHKTIVVELRFCPLCGDYLQRLIHTTSLSRPLVEIVKAHRYRSSANA